jgi:hypothetical protein
MATWNALKAHIHQHWPGGEDTGDRIKLVLGMVDRQPRTQIVFVSHQRADDSGDWAIIESPIGLLEQSPSGAYAGIDLMRAAREVGSMLCGGLGCLTHEPRLVALRHAVPLANLDLDEFNHPLFIVTGSADELEEMLTGSDEV